MLYPMYDAVAATLAPFRWWARTASSMLRHQVGPDYLTWPVRAAVAWADVAEDVLRPPGQARLEHQDAPRRRRRPAGAGGGRSALRPAAPLQGGPLHRTHRSAGRTHERPSRDAAARHRAGHGRSRARRLCHRLARRADRAGFGRRVRSRQLYPNCTRLPPASRPGHARGGGVPARAGRGGGRVVDGRRERPGAAAQHDPDGRPRGHPGGPQRPSPAWPRSTRSLGSSRTWSRPCRPGTPARSAGCIRGSCSCSPSCR